MEQRTRRRFERAIRVRDFSRANPSTGEGYTEIVVILEDKVEKLEVLATQQETGFLTAKAATASKDELHGILHDGSLVHLRRIAKGAAGEHPELLERFRLPRRDANPPTYLARTRAIVEQAATHKELFIRDGLPESFLDDLNRQVGEYQAALAAQESATALHIGARAEISVLLKEITGLVKRLDGINQFRFRDDPEKLAVWNRAKDTTWPAKSPSPEGGKPAVA